MCTLEDVLGGTSDIHTSCSTSVDIFGGGEELGATVPSSPFRRRRRSANIDARHLSSSRIESTELLSQCISILQSIISEDCQFPLTPPRPSRPPNSLQAISLDIALLLVHMHAKSYAVISQVGFALLPAFVTFKPEMYPRLLLFFEGTLRGMLHEERKLRSSTKGGAGILKSRGVFPDSLFSCGIFLITPLSIEHFIELEADDAPPPVVSIQVEPYEDAHTSPGGDIDSWTSRPTYASRCIPSQNASGQPLASYQLLSLVSPLLATISDAIDFGTASAFTTHRLRHLFHTIVDLRLDASLNVLEVVAYHTPKARSTALGLLYSYWPRAIGHCFVTRPFESLADSDTSPSQDTHAHQFVLWKFTEPSAPSLFDGNILRECRLCLKQIFGAGLFCPLCFCAVHFDCYDYPNGNLLMQYPVEPDSGTQRVAVHRFCHVQPSTNDHKSSVRHISGHIFRVVNMFTLALCFICKSPLWGCHSQGLKCDNCSHFVHAQCIQPVSDATQCLRTPLTSTHITTSLHDLRGSFDNHFRGLLGLDPSSVRHHEEKLICSDILWVQRQILSNGLALGSIIIEGGDETSRLFSLELQTLLDCFEADLLSQTSVPSEMLSGFFDECRFPSRTTLLFDWSTLVFLATSARFMDGPSHDSTGSTLDPFLGTRSDGMSRHDIYEAIPLHLLRDNFAANFHIHLDIAAETLLRQLHHVGLFELPEICLLETKDLLHYKESLCLFALPLSLDLSASVETLITAIEACLLDIDLSVNEAGFLLLVRRVWPTEMSTEYALRRLMKSVLGWILAEVSSFTFRFKPTCDLSLEGRETGCHSSGLRPSRTGTSRGSYE